MRDMNEEQELKQQKVDNTFKERSIHAYNFRTLASAFVVFMSAVGVIVLLAYAQPTLARIITAPDTIQANSKAIENINKALNDYSTLRDDHSNLQGHVNQLRHLIEQQQKAANQFERQLERLEYAIESQAEQNKIHRANLIEAIQELRRR